MGAKYIVTWLAGRLLLGGLQLQQQLQLKTTCCPLIAERRYLLLAPDDGTDHEA